MQVKTQRFSTEQVSPEYRAEYWRDVTRDSFVKLDFPELEKSFQGEILSRSFSNARLTTVETTKHAVRRRRTEISSDQEEVVLISLQRRGIGKIAQDGRSATLLPGDVVLYDSRRPYDLTFNDRVEQLIFSVDLESISARMPSLVDFTARRIDGAGTYARLVRTYLETLAAGMDENDALEVQPLSSNIMDLIAAAFVIEGGVDISRSTDKALKVYRIKSFIERNLHLPHLTVKMIADEMRTTPRYIHILFEEEGLSVSKFIYERRLLKCRDDLSSPAHASKTITEISFQWGFNDSSHFTRSFRSRFGMTPSEFRRMRTQTEI